MVKLFGRRETLVVTAAGLERKHQQEGAHKRSAQPSGRAVARASGKHDVGHGEPFCPGSFYLDLLLAATYTRSGIGEDMRLPKLASLNLRIQLLLVHDHQADREGCFLKDGNHVVRAAAGFREKH